LLKDNLVLAFLVTLILCVSVPAWGDSNYDTNSQTNQSGSNTQITGGYTSTTTNTYAGGQTNTTTSTTTSSTNGAEIPPPSANSPSYSSMSQDVCSMGVSGSVSTGVFGLSGGKHVVDLNCERIKLAKVLQDFGMKVASVAVLCQDPRVFMAMEAAGTPCPFDGKIGAEAAALWDTYEELRPDYKLYKERMEIRAEVDAVIAAELADQIARDEEAARKAQEELDKQLESQITETSPPKKEAPVINVHK
jgi:hypothetical protein